MDQSGDIRRKQGIELDYERFRQLLLSIMREHDFMSGRRLADFLKISHSSIAYFLSEKGGKDRTPSMEMLERIADKTGTPLTAILGDVFPHLRKHFPEEQLSPEERELLAAFRRNDLTGVSRLIMSRLEQQLRERGDIPGGDTPESR